MLLPLIKIGRYFQFLLQEMSLGTAFLPELNELVYAASSHQNWPIL
jgi:hypothetical protein